jgi:hypothetical protein
MASNYDNFGNTYLGHETDESEVDATNEGRSREISTMEVEER